MLGQMSGNMSLQSDVNLVPYWRCDYEHYLHDIFFLMYVFLLCFFSSLWWQRKAIAFKLKKKNNYLVFWPCLREHFSLHFKVRKCHTSLDVICKVCPSVVFVISHGFWLSYCFALASAPCVMRPTCMFLSHSSQTISVKYGHFLPFSSFMAL